jgi:hypothetical protein
MRQKKGYPTGALKYFGDVNFLAKFARGHRYFSVFAETTA